MRRLSELGLLPFGAGAGVASALVVLQLTDPFALVSLSRERGFDVLYTAFPRRAVAAKVVVVDIDERTLSQVGDWPLPRARLAELTERLAAAKPSVVAFDIYFEAADRHSPRALAEELARLPQGAPIRQIVEAMPDFDARFGDALRAVPSAIGALAGKAGAFPSLNAVKVDGALTGRTVSIDGIAGPYPPLADAALGIGIQSLWGEDDGLVRQVPLILRTTETIVPGLALEAARIGVGAPYLEVKAVGSFIAFGPRRLRLDAGGAMRLHWSDPRRWTARTISALDVLAGKVPANRVNGAAVLIGSSAPQVGALRPTAAGALTPSVQVQAEAVEQILDGSAPYRAAWMVAAEAALTLALGLASARLAATRGPLAGFAALAGVVLVWLAGSIAAFRLFGVLVDPVWPAGGAIAAVNAAAIAAFARTRRLKTRISRRFEQYLAPDVVRAIVARPDRLKLDGEMREVTALFTDIEGFTGLTRLEPRQLIALLDPYFDGVCGIITEHGGMVDSIVGDAVHAFFNMPLDLPDHADVGVACAVAIARFADEFRRRPDAAQAAFGRTRIGLETGPAIVGDVGGPRRFNYTAHGAVANAAARLEAANKEFGTTVCIGPGTVARARRSEFRPLGSKQLRGFPGPLDIYTVAVDLS